MNGQRAGQQPPKPGVGMVPGQKPPVPPAAPVADQPPLAIPQGVTENAVGNPELPKSAVGIYDLPGGYIDAAGTLHQQVEMKEMTGVEEDILSSRGGDVLSKLDRVIANCIVRVGTVSDRAEVQKAVMELPIADRNFLIVALRRTSLGDIYQMEVKCPNCERQSRMDLDLATMVAEQMKDPMQREAEAVLPSGRTVKWRVMTGQEEHKLLQIRTATEKDGLSYAIMLRLLEVDGKEISLGRRMTDAGGKLSLDKDAKEALREVKSLTLRDRNFLRTKFREAEGGMDTDVEFVCPECDKKATIQFDPAQLGFFFPSGM